MVVSLIVYFEFTDVNIGVFVGFYLGGLEKRVLYCLQAIHDVERLFPASSLQ